PRVIPMHSAFVLVVSAGLAMATPSHADGHESSGGHASLRVPRVPSADASPREGLIDGAFVMMRDELENFPLNTSFGGDGVVAPPTSFTGPPGFTWPDNTLTGQSAG